MAWERWEGFLKFRTEQNNPWHFPHSASFQDCSIAAAPLLFLFVESYPSDQFKAQAYYYQSAIFSPYSGLYTRIGLYSKIAYITINQ